MSLCRGIRGATTVPKDESGLILEATKEMLVALQKENNIDWEDVASIFFSTSPDIASVFPAKVREDIPGLQHVPLFCAQEIDVEGALPLCIRILVHWNTNKSQNEIQHVYLEGARALRPDL